VHGVFVLKRDVKLQLTCTVHKTAYRLCCYTNIPKYSKLFIKIVRETSVRETSVTRCSVPMAIKIRALRSCNVDAARTYWHLPTLTVMLIV